MGFFIVRSLLKLKEKIKRGSYFCYCQSLSNLGLLCTTQEVKGGFLEDFQRIFAKLFFVNFYAPNWAKSVNDISNLTQFQRKNSAFLLVRQLFGFLTPLGSLFDVVSTSLNFIRNLNLDRHKLTVLTLIKIYHYMRNVSTLDFCRKSKLTRSRWCFLM